MGKVMATVEEIKQKRKVALRLYEEGKTYKELAEIFGVSVAKIRGMCGQARRDIDSQRKHKIFIEDQALRDLYQLLPILEDIKGLTKNGGS